MRPIASILAALLLALPAPLQAQTIEDGYMMAKQTLFTGPLYTRESWDEYWEGTLERSNDNIGRITTQAGSWYANYGLLDRLNVIAAVPYVWTRASLGVLHGIRGFQDVTLAAKVNALERLSGDEGWLRVIGVVAAGIPLTDYNPELPPLSIGTGSSRVSWRGTLNFQTNPGWFVNGTAAWVWRSQVQLDRPYFYTDDEFVMSDQVDMPNAADGMVSGGYMKKGRMFAATLSQQRTLGGGDIRRQDMPFVSNRRNASKVGALVMYPVPKLQGLTIHVAYDHTFDGRNAGQADSFTTGLLYRLGRAPR